MIQLNFTIKTIIILLLINIPIFVISGCSSQPSYRSSTTPLTTETFVDLDRYQGRWFEIARLPNRFEKNCEGVTADYARRSDGLISVKNTCRKGSPGGPIKVGKGRARIVDETTNAKLEVSFFGPFWGDYWVLDLDADYTLSIVGEPEGKYLWILSRTPTISAEQQTRALSFLKALGYDISALYFTKQPPIEEETLTR